MDAPPVQYASTPDGLSIAYTVCGSGTPLLFAPLGLNHVQLSWRYDHRITGWLEGLSARFRLVRYDSRGQGLSSRGLQPGVSMLDYVSDLSTVADKLDLQRFVLLGYFYSGHVAIRYAAEHPERVAALILVSTSTSMSAWPLAAPLGLAQQAWEIFLRSWVPEGSTREETEAYVSYFKQTATVADYELCARAFATSDVSDLLPRLSMPVLVIHPRDFLWLASDEVTKLASRIPNARLVLTEGSVAFGDVDQGMAAIDAFGEEMASPPNPLSTSGGEGEHEPEATSPPGPGATSSPGPFSLRGEGEMGRASPPSPLSPGPHPLPPLRAYGEGVQPPASSLGMGGLSVREVEVLALLARGLSNAAIASALVLSVRTVERHINHIYAKAGVANRVEASRWAQARGIG